LGVLGYAILLAATCAAVTGVWGVDGKAVTAQLSSARSANQKASAALVSGARRLSQAQSTRSTVEALSDQPDWSLLLTLLGQELDEDLVLREVRLRPAERPKTAPALIAAAAAGERFRLELRGLGRTQEAVSRFVSRLEGKKLFSEVSLLRRAREPFLADTAVSFDLECVLGDAKERN